MSGKEDGLTYLALQDILNECQKQTSSSGVACELSLSYMEIYKEECFDLLATGSNKKLELKETMKGETILDGLKSKPIKSIEDAHNLLIQAGNSRSTGSTIMNQSSSRSHSICTITLSISSGRNSTSNNIADNGVICSRFRLVDLAGSEKPRGESLQEGISINKGLLALGNVIAALAQKSKPMLSSSSSTADNFSTGDNTKENTVPNRENGARRVSVIGNTSSSIGASAAHIHVPYRESKLTRLLKDALGGNGMCVLLACVSPAAQNYDETKNTLLFASRASSIINVAHINTFDAVGSSSTGTSAAVGANSECISAKCRGERLLLEDTISRAREETYKAEQKCRELSTLAETTFAASYSECAALEEELEEAAGHLVAEKALGERLCGGILVLSSSLRSLLTHSLEQVLHT
jgi:hypothetical protein